MRIAVLGAGAWGTALACSAAPRHEVTLWARDAHQAQALREQRENARYLRGVQLPGRLAVTADIDEALPHSGPDLAVIASPMGGLRGLLRRVPAGVPVLWLCKGLESGSGLLGHEIAQQERPGSPAGVLSGPSFAIEVARGQPTAVVAASTDARLRDLAVEAFHLPSLRVYTSDDPVGVEVGGAVKNVMAIAAGLLDGLASAAGPSAAAPAPGTLTGALPDSPASPIAPVAPLSPVAPAPAAPASFPGLNARAALITRGLAEMSRLGVALGAQAQTFMGLSGLGDLVLTATGALSRNRQVGLLLAQGRGLQEVLLSLGHVAEGVHTAPVVLARARSLGVDMPITEAVVDVLEGRTTAAQAMSRLMSREARAEAGAAR